MATATTITTGGPAERDADEKPKSRRNWVAEALGVAFVVVAAIVLLLPALLHGWYLGPYDMLSTLGLTAKSGVVAHNASYGDQITQMIPWTALDWTQVHHGHLPLWNSYNGVGVPLAFNWQSAAFSVPSLLGYLVPLHSAYTVSVLSTILIAGTGVYVLGRVLGLGVMASAFAATIFELSGPMVAWLGYEMAAVMSWLGWIFAVAILLYRGRHRVRYIVLLGVLFAFAVYAGHPEALFLLVMAFAVFVVVLLTNRTRWFGGSGPILRPAMDTVIAGVLGALLSAPLALPALQLLPSTARSATTGVSEGVSLSLLPNVAFSSFYGMPVAGWHWFPAGSKSALFNESAAYVGLVALVMAFAVAVVQRRRPAVMAFIVVTCVTAFVAFFGLGLFGSVPFIAKAGGSYALMPMAFAIAVLAGFAMQALRSPDRDRRVLKWMGWTFAVAGVLLGLLWLISHDRLNPLNGGRLPAADAATRNQSFIWPVVSTVVGLIAVGALVYIRRRRSAAAATSPVRTRTGLSPEGWICAGLLVVETAFLITAGAPLWDASASIPPPTQAVTSLQKAVGSAVVGVGDDQCSIYRRPSLGIVVNDNILYGVHEFDIYDTATTTSYFKSWWGATQATKRTYSNWFCPDVTSAQLAKLFGVSYVLESHGDPGPKGAVFVKTLGGEDLYRIPDASVATAVEPTGTGAPGEFAAGTPVAVSRPTPASMKIRTDYSSPRILRLRIADVPGWSASIDGKPLALHPFAGLMLQARIPAGAHTVELHYWPPLLTVGLVLAILAIIGSLVAIVIARRRASTTT